jgi:hypothetical protein
MKSRVTSFVFYSKSPPFSTAPSMDPFDKALVNMKNELIKNSASCRIFPEYNL